MRENLRRFGGFLFERHAYLRSSTKKHATVEFGPR
jgi:hypothetical protein